MLHGRLADPDCTIGTDSRADPRMVTAFTPLGLDGHLPVPPLTLETPLADRLAFAQFAEDSTGAIIASFTVGLPPVPGVSTSTTTISGVDGNDITLYISRPDDAKGALPGIVHLHGGGMAILAASDPGYHYIRESLAATGLVVVGVEFRNSAGKLGAHPYPAGLNDCASATRWVAANRAELGVSHVVVAGESGGGNLTLTVAHKAKREGWLAEIAGLYAQCPFISNKWLQQPDELSSLKENDNYFINCLQLALLGSLYDPDGTHAHDAACWALEATEHELKGMPPHVVSVNELDPLRDEGLLYYRRLLHAGVPAVGRVVAGTCHAGDLLLPAAMPDVFAASVRDVSGFAKSLG